MRKLRDVTLMTVTGLAIEDAVEALRVSMRDIEFAAVKLLAPTRPHVLPLGVEHVAIPPIDFLGYSRTVLSSLCRHFDTSHCLIVQADGFVLNPALWREEFLAYDYVGAPWPEELYGPGNRLVPLDRNRVGNGGFSLRSHKLMEIAAGIDFDRLDLPVRNEDLVLCHYLYDEMRTQGVKYAPLQLAAQFSVEAPLGQRLDSVFGFHGKHLLPYVFRRLPEADFRDLRARQRRSTQAPP